MKCTACRGEFYPMAYDTLRDHGSLYHQYTCPWCGEDIFFKVTCKRRFHKEKFLDFVSGLMVVVVIFLSTYHIFSNPEKFFTTF